MQTEAEMQTTDSIICKSSCHFHYPVLAGNRGFQARVREGLNYLDSTVYPLEKCEKKHMLSSMTPADSDKKQARNKRFQLYHFLPSGSANVIATTSKILRSP